MNERIKKIAKDAGVLGDWGEDVLEGRLFITGNTKQMEKFAELILKECFQYLENEEDRLWDLSEKEEDDIFQSNFEICAEKCRDVRQGLKDHFGVEE